MVVTEDKIFSSFDCVVLIFSLFILLILCPTWVLVTSWFSSLETIGLPKSSKPEPWTSSEAQVDFSIFLFSSDTDISSTGSSDNPGLVFFSIIISSTPSCSNTGFCLLSIIISSISSFSNVGFSLLSIIISSTPSCSSIGFFLLSIIISSISSIDVSLLSFADIDISSTDSNIFSVLFLALISISSIDSQYISSFSFLSSFFFYLFKII